MSNIRRSVMTDRIETVGDSTDATQQRHKEVMTTETADAQLTLANFVWLLVGLIETVLALRFVMKLTGANPNNGFVDFVYRISGFLTAPFDNIFNVASTSNGSVKSVFEPSILVAMLVYFLIGWAIVKLITLNRTDG